jgi:molybdopterin-guanine dinucleotide biosynthesis protein A
MNSLCIQAGGKSSRMGVDKGLVNFCGKPMLQNVLDRLGKLSDDKYIITERADEYRKFGLPIYPDFYKNYGALAGLHSGLKNASHDIVYMVACDMPFAGKNLFLYMGRILETSEVDVVIPLTEHGHEPMHAVYRKKTCLPAIENAIQNQKKRLISWFDQVRVIAVGEKQLRSFDPELSAFLNINTPDELLAAEEKCI